jgi:hypothetical protein
MFGESLVGLRRKDPRKDAVARDSSDPGVRFAPSNSLASPKYLALRKIKLGVLRLDNKSLRCVVVFNPGHSPSPGSEHYAFGSFVAAIWACRKEQRCHPYQHIYVFIATSVRFLAFSFLITLRT